MIKAEALTKTFRVHKKEPGLIGSIKSLISRKWHDKTALNAATIEIKSGEIVGLIGANGAGKTTLVKLLSGIIHPSSGTAEVLGHTPWKRSNDFRRQIALIMGQKAQLWWDLPADDCFLLLKEIYQIPEKEFHERKQKLTELLGVKDQLNIQIRRLSLGERMKMELMAALLHNPKVVFLDEPTIGLDLTAQRAIRKFIKDYQQENKPAVILTSHYMEDIVELCQRIIIMREGAIVYDGPLSKVVSQYAKHKTLGLVVEPHALEGKTAKDFEAYGEVLEFSSEGFKIKVARERATQIAGQLLSQLSVVDLNIEEADISDIIEAILRKKGAHV